jgi:hypothetical protein
MERLKSILADKVLSLSADSGEEVKAKIDKIRRFRDFANALRSFMIKYPAIEDELISMVEDGDFDTKVASSRVDTVIRLADAEAAQSGQAALRAAEPAATSGEMVVAPPVAVAAEENNQEEDTREEPAAEDTRNTGAEPDDNDINPDDIPMEVYTGGEGPVYVIRPEDISLEAEEQPVVEEEDGSDILSEEEQAAKRKMTIRRVLQVVGIIFAVAALIFLVKFVMNHLQAFLIISGIVVVVVILIVWLKRKR